MRYPWSGVDEMLMVAHNDDEVGPNEESEYQEGLDRILERRSPSMATKPYAGGAWPEFAVDASQPDGDHQNQTSCSVA